MGVPGHFKATPYKKKIIKKINFYKEKQVKFILERIQYYLLSGGARRS